MDQRLIAALAGMLLTGCQDLEDATSRRGAGAIPPRLSTPSSQASTGSEPWSEQPPLPPGLLWGWEGHEVRRSPGLRLRPPPPGRRPAPELERVLRQVEHLWRQGRRAAAQTLAAARTGPSTSTRDLAAVALSPCSACARTAIKSLLGRLRRRAWIWSEARFLLPALGSPSEPVRAAALEAFAWAASRLGPKRLRLRLEPHLPVFRYLTLDRSPWVRAEAITLLGLMRDRVAHQRLLDASRDRFPRVRMAAVQAISRAIGLVPGAPTTARICQLLADRSAAVRSTALQGLRSAPRACGLAPVIGLLGDASLARLILLSDASAPQGVRQPPWPSVREAALQALPPLCRQGLAQGAPLGLRIRRARQIARLLLPPLAAVPRPGRWQVRPGRPLPALPLVGLAPAVLTRAATGSPLRELLRHESGVDALRRKLRQPAAQARLALVLAGLGSGEIRRALVACDRVPLRGALLVQVLGLLAHVSAGVRLGALGILNHVIDDRRDEALSRALWLAKRDPHPLVRAAALRLLTRWHEGPAVRRRLHGALGDRHPVVQREAIRPALRLATERTATLLKTRLGSLHPLVRADALAALIPDPVRRPAARIVARYLDDQAQVLVRVTLGGRRVVVGDQVTVSSRVLEALEAVFGVRHRGSPRRRALRWQDELLRGGWSLPPRN